MIARRGFLMGGAAVVAVTFVERDFFFPEKPTTDRRYPLWRDIIRDNDGRVVRFPFVK